MYSAGVQFWGAPARHRTSVLGATFTFYVKPYVVLLDLPGAHRHRGQPR